MGKWMPRPRNRKSVARNSSPRQRFVDWRRARAPSPACRECAAAPAPGSATSLSSSTPLRLAQVHRQDEQRGQLAGERLGGSHADLRPGVRVEGAGGLARDHGAHHVADGQRLRAFLLGLALRGQRVGRLARLRDHHRQRVVADDRIAVAELAAVIHLHRDARQLLDHELAGQRRRASWCRRR